MATRRWTLELPVKKLLLLLLNIQLLAYVFQIITNIFFKS